MDQRQLQIVLRLKDQASKEINRVAGNISTAERATNQWSGAFRNVTRLAKIAGAAIGVAATAGIGFGIRVAAQLETAEVGLTTLLGSSVEAAKTIERLKVEAARTPFELPGLTKATQLLTSITKDGDKSIDILLNVGEALAAMGKGQAELDRIIINLQQVASVGKASMIDVKQFAFAGIPIFEMLEEHFGSNRTQEITNNSKELSKNAASLLKYQNQLAVTVKRQSEFTEKTKQSSKISAQFKVEDLTNKIASLNEENKKLNATNGQVVSSITSVGDAIADGEVTFELLNELFDKANDEGGKFFNAFQNQSGTFTQAFSNMKDTMGIFLAETVVSTGIFDGLTQAMIRFSTAMGDKTFDEFLEKIDLQTGLITFLKESFNSMMDAIEPILPTLREFAKIMGGVLLIALMAFVKGVELSVIGISNIILLSQELTTFLIGPFGKAWDFVAEKIEQVTEGVNNLIDSFKRAFTAAGNLPGKIGSAIVNAVIPGRASGGPVTGGNAFMVGEEGPELFVPKQNGTIIPNGSTGGMSVNVTINGDVSGTELVERVQDAIMRSLRMNTKLAI